MPQLFSRNGRWLTLEQVRTLEKKEKDEKEAIEKATSTALPMEDVTETIKKTEEKKESDENICDICQKVCKSKAGLAVHKLSHKEINI